MPKKSVFECSCDRCGRVWYVEQGEKEPPTSSFKMELTLPDGKITKVIYETLCETCTKAVANYATNIARDLKTVSKAKKDAPEAAPPPPPPAPVPPPSQHRKR